MNQIPSYDSILMSLSGLDEAQKKALRSGNRKKNDAIDFLNSSACSPEIKNLAQESLSQVFESLCQEIDQIKSPGAPVIN